ncbi:MAG TPA: hypothetical protein VH740_24990 [Vicinamibacterales bacterium]
MLAIVPIDCCAAHRPKAEPKCHEAATAHHAAAPQNAGDECRLQGTCGGPMGALTALLSNYGILPTAPVSSPSLEIAATQVRALENLIRRVTPPDPQPPRA